jgi:hypothetical protein
VEQILGRISGETKSVKQGFGSLFQARIDEVLQAYPDEDIRDYHIRNISIIRWQINEAKQDFEKQLLILTKGNVAEAAILRKSSVKTYLAKLDNYITEIENSKAK